MLTKPSLRERKRSQTWTAIHELAADAAMQRSSLADVTIDEITEQAGVSARTFFNYFPTKDDAVMGLRPPVIDDEIAERFVIEAGDDLVEKVTELLYAVMQSTAGGVMGRERRFALMRRYPELVRKRIEHADRVKDLVRELVAERLETSARWTARKHTYSPQDAAVILVSVAHAAVRVAVESVLDSPPDHLNEDIAVRHAARLLREVIEET